MHSAFITPGLWLNSHDINPVDQKSGYNSATSLPEEVQDVNDLKQRLIDVWAGIEDRT